MPYRHHHTELKDLWFFRKGPDVQAAFMQRDNLENPADTRPFRTTGHARTADRILLKQALPATGLPDAATAPFRAGPKSPQDATAAAAGGPHPGARSQTPFDERTK